MLVYCVYFLEKSVFLQDDDSIIYLTYDKFVSLLLFIHWVYDLQLTIKKKFHATKKQHELV